MPRNYVRTSNRQTWSEEQMKNAIMEVIEGRSGYRLASRTFSVPQSTLEDRVKKYRINNDITAASKKGLGRFKTIFTDEQENSMCQHIKDLEAQLFGLTYRDFRYLAFQMAEKNGIDHNFNKNTELAGMDWLYGFLRRHPELSLRLPEPTSVARAMGFNRVNVAKFFSLLVELQTKHQFEATKIFNVDETGITTVPKKKSKVLSLKGKKQVGIISSAERGQLTTAVLCVSAAGHYVPPLLIFPRVRMKAELLDGAPPGTIAMCHPSGWIQSEIFVHWLEHFISNVKPTRENPVLLLLDGHSTHTKNLQLIEKARENGVIIVSFPPHCTHRLQPLDVSIMGPISTFYSQEVMTWLRNNPGRVVTQFQLAKLFGIAYAKAATLQNAISAFTKTGICPLNPNIFSDHDFISSTTTDNEIPASEPTPSTSESVTAVIRDKNTVNNTIVDKNVPVHNAKVINSHSSSAEQLGVSPRPNIALPSASTSAAVSPADILPKPHVVRKINSNSRRGKTAIITSSPYKAELEESAKKTNKKKVPKLDAKIANPKKKKFSDNMCVYCSEIYGNTRRSDDWVQCLKCKKWAHVGCTGWEEEELDDFLCFRC